MISIYEVIQAVDPLQRIHECPLGLEAHAGNLCPLHKRLDDAMSLIEEQFRATMIAELLEVASTARMMPPSGPACSFPLSSTR